jgi:Tol biopolymer transport system component
VTREALIARAWPDVFVTDDVLHRAVRELRRVFGDSSSEPRYIETIRKRGYRLMVTADLEPAAAVEGRQSTGDSSRFSRSRGQAEAWPHTAPRAWPMAASAAALIVALALVLVGLSIRKDTTTEAQARFVPLVSGASNESDPAVAPDGVRLAYVVRDTANDQADIYVQPRPGVSAERLTDNPSDDRLPAWSPEGRRLAFVRMSGAQCEIFVRSLDAASEQRIARCANPDEPRLAWMLDGESLVVSEIVDGSPGPARLARLMLASGALTPITSPPAESIGDHSPAISPDGRSIAFIRHSTGGAADVFIVASTGGAARRVTFDEADLTGVDWTARGRALVFSSDRAGGYSLWRVGVEGGEPQLVAGGAARLKHPVSARAVDRVAYESWNYEINLWEVALAGQVGRGRPVVATSELWNLYPQLSPDGSKLAYVSTQSGTHELWLAAGDGSSPRQLTAFGSEVRALARGTSVRPPRWSPDGRRIVFAAQRAARVDLYVFDVGTGTLTAMTADDAIEASPSWSSDSRRVYYSVRDGDRSNVWVRDATAGREPELAIAGGVAAQSGQNGALYFTRADRAGVWRLAGDGSAATVVAETVGAGDSLSWAVTPGELFFVAQEGREIVLRRTPLTGGAVERMATLPNYSWPGFSIDAGGTRVLYARWDRRESNIMAAESVTR